MFKGYITPKSLWWMLDVKQLWRHLSAENCRVIKADKTGEVRFRNKKFVVFLTISNIQQEVKTIVILLYYVVYFVNINIVFHLVILKIIFHPQENLNVLILWTSVKFQNIIKCKNCTYVTPGEN